MFGKMLICGYRCQHVCLEKEWERGGGHLPPDLPSSEDSVHDLDEISGLDRGSRSVDQCDQSRGN